MRILLPIVFLLLAACSSAPVQDPTQYLLRSSVIPTTGSVDSAMLYDLSAVEVAPYLDSLGLVLETASGEIHTARLHQWAEPLRLSLPRFMALEIGEELGQPVSLRSGDINATRLLITIDQFHGTDDGAALLVAYWRIEGPEGTMRQGQFSKQQSLSRDGYPALVQAQRALLRQLAVEIAATLGS